eukprot:scpid37835/ scgid0249/ 5&apos
MGVPAFFRWLSRKYASIVVHCREEKAREVNGVKIPVDTTAPNPNDTEFDNLYLDMNGIIHPCCHPEDRPAPKNEDEMFELIFEYIDRIFAIVRPRKVLYMAIDGVAPRAKMNQQRSRRFRASKESVDKVNDIERIRRELQDKGCHLPPPKEKKEHFDSNCITPGTEFMANLAVALRYYVAHRLNNDPGWKNVKVILSDANSPGEGEHKIMDYIRHQRSQPDHDPNTHHCLYGADADLIMLGLATHEPQFTILREEFKPGQVVRTCDICGQPGHEMAECEGLPKEKINTDGFDPMPVAEKEFIFIRLCVLREYLEKTLRLDGLTFPFDFERALDDWVFLCFFVGNDFLPHLPSLEIREGAIDRLVGIYKDVVPRCGDYLTKAGHVNLRQVQMLMKALGEMEDSIFKKRQEDDKEFRRRARDRKRQEKLRRAGREVAPVFIHGGSLAPTPIGQTPTPVHGAKQVAADARMQRLPTTPSGPASEATTPSSNTAAAADIRSQLRAIRNQSGESPSSQATTPGGVSVPGDSPSSGGVKRKHNQVDEDEDDAPPDNVRLWEEGWRARYYEHKFGIDALEDVVEYNRFRREVANAYVQGLCWVLAYYYQGCPSWKWYYPFHYAPFASDFPDITELDVAFEANTQPFNPLEQLMGVFPAASGKFLPESWRTLMSSDESPIIDFYPTDFKIDLNGKKFAWMGVALLPFVDEKRLLGALAGVYDDLSPEEKFRNSRGSDRLCFHRSNSAFDFVNTAVNECTDGEEEAKPVALNAKQAQGMGGLVWKCKDDVTIGGVVEARPSTLESVDNNQSICVHFIDPPVSEGYTFPACMLKNAQLPGKVLKPEDHDVAQQGGRRGGRGGYRPQMGFTPRNNQAHRDASTANRFIRNSMQGGTESHDGRRFTPTHYNQRGGFGRGGGGYGRGGSVSVPNSPQYWGHHQQQQQPYDQRHHQYDQRQHHDPRQQQHHHHQQQQYGQHGGNNRHSYGGNSGGGGAGVAGYSPWAHHTPRGGGGRGGG